MKVSVLEHLYRLIFMFSKFIKCGVFTDYFYQWTVSSGVMALTSGIFGSSQQLLERCFAWVNSNKKHGVVARTCGSYKL
jgi:hypothetical protein